MKKIVLRLILSILLLFGLLFVMFNIWQNSVTDRSVITGIPCAIPCWQGITPGTTTRQEAISKISNSPYVQKSNILLNDRENGEMLWSWQTFGNYRKSRIAWNNDVVTEINLGMSIDLTVDYVIAKYGPPESIHVSTWGSPDTPETGFTLLYPSNGFDFTVYYEYDDALEIQANKEISRVDCYFPTSLENRINILYQSTPDLIPRIIKQLRPWKGYGKIIGLYYERPQDFSDFVGH